MRNRLWSYTICADHRDPDRPGFVWAPTAAVAILLIGDEDANVYELPADADYIGPEVLNPSARRVSP